MFTAAATVGGALVKRLAEGNAPQEWSFPAPAAWFLLGDILIFLPVIILFGYTLDRVFPTLAAVEDPLPAYEALPADDDDDDDTGKDGKEARPALHSRAAREGKPTTSSLRATARLLRSQGGGWLGLLRGIRCAAVVNLLTVATTALLSLVPFIPARVAHLIALVAVAPLSTAWAHVVITPRSAKSFFSRIPPVRKTLVATALPTAALWAALNLNLALPALLSRVIGLSMGPVDLWSSSPEQLMQTAAAQRAGPAPWESASEAAKALCVAGVWVALHALLVVPARTARTRAQASLLPADEDTVVPFDRSFGGRVAPELAVGGSSSGGAWWRLGFAALRSVPAASWRRIYLQRVKILAVNVAAYLVFVAIVIAQGLVVFAMCYGPNGSSKC